MFRKGSEGGHRGGGSILPLHPRSLPKENTACPPPPSGQEGSKERWKGDSSERLPTPLPGHLVQGQLLIWSLEWGCVCVYDKLPRGPAGQ